MPGKDRLRGKRARIGRSFCGRTHSVRSSASPKMRQSRARSPSRSPEAARVWRDCFLPLAVCSSRPSCPFPSCRRFLSAPSAFPSSLSKACATWEGCGYRTSQQGFDSPANTYISMSSSDRGSVRQGLQGPSGLINSGSPARLEPIREPKKRCFNKKWRSTDIGTSTSQLASPDPDLADRQAAPSCLGIVLLPGAGQSTLPSLSDQEPLENSSRTASVLIEARPGGK